MTGLRRNLLVAAVLTVAGFSPAARAEGPAPVPVPGAAAPLDRAAARMTVPPGFHVSLFAGEPDVRQPIALTFDRRGRLWVVECYSYPQWEQGGKPGRDRVLIFEDHDGDGKFDRRTVFWDKGANLSGIEVGFGGVWLCASPNLLFIPDRDGDDKPDSAPEVVLDGWSLDARHNVFNGLIWAPDGWLWGCNGILATSRVGPPGTPDDRRTAINCGIWRYHPTRKVFETVANGTTNPWGLDFDDYGEAFLTNCVIPHLFHVIPGAHYQRMYGQDFNLNLYELMGTCGDHVHWDTTERWLDIRSRGVTATTDKAGGGHAHSGAAVYLGNSWPDRYRNTVLMGNIHGNRLNLDRLEPKGSGYVARHEPDLLMANDPWFRSVAQRLGPDGSIYVLDWSDTGECHEDDADGAHRENGRIYRVSYGKSSPNQSGIASDDPGSLAGMQKSRSEWHVRQARLMLQEYAAAGRDLSGTRDELRGLLEGDPRSTVNLRALWALNVTGGIDADGLTQLLDSRVEHLRAWAVRLLVDDRDRLPPAAALTAFARLAKDDPSPKVRLALASALQCLPLDRRGAIADALMGHAEDAGDQNLPLMVWYGVEPLVPADLNRSAGWALNARIPTVGRNVARRVVAADLTRGLDALVAVLKNPTDNPGGVRNALEGMSEALQGRKSVPMPEGWTAAVGRLKGDDGLVWRLSLVFGDRNAVTRLRALLTDASAAPETRRLALRSLAAARVPGVAADLAARLDDTVLRGDALRALAAFDDPAVPRALLDRYPSLTGPEREDAIATLAARPAWSLALLDAVSKGTVPRRDVSATVARQIQAFGRPEVSAALESSWGTLRPTAGDKTALLAKYKAKLTPDRLKSADLARGRTVFQKTCQQCHKMYGEGGDVGPELTGSNRDNLDYVLENVLDPSASVGNDYKLLNVATTDGRLVSGIVKSRTDAALVLQTPNDRVVIPRDEIEAEKSSPASMMPEGLFGTLDDDEVRDLIAYLAARK